MAENTAPALTMQSPFFAKREFATSKQWRSPLRKRKPVQLATTPAAEAAAKCPVKVPSMLDYISVSRVSGFFKRHKYIRRMAKVGATVAVVDTFVLAE